MTVTKPSDYKFWTFLVQSITIQAVSKDGLLGSDVLVTGWFAFSSVAHQQVTDGTGFEPMLSTDVITDPATPTVLRLKSEHFGNKATEEISAKDVMTALRNIFSVPFDDVPRPPQDPKTSLPPSKRGKKKP